MIEWIAKHAELVGVIFAIAGFVLPFATLAFSAWRYVEVRRAEQKQLRFDNYHLLIAKLVGDSQPNPVMRLDSQIAVAFELRNFKQYKEVSIRILTGLIDEWSDREFQPRLIEEMRRTVEELKPNSSIMRKCLRAAAAFRL